MQPAATRPLTDSDVRGPVLTLYLAFELGNREWQLGFTTGFGQPPRERTIAARDQAALTVEITHARQRFALPAGGHVRSCYEAGRDGFWLHRALTAQGVANLVVDSSSIEVNRRARRAKSDRLDVRKLLTMLLRYDAGERRVWHVVHVPTREEEDRRQLHRELMSTKRDRTRVTNRIKGLLANQGVPLVTLQRFTAPLPALAAKVLFEEKPMRGSRFAALIAAAAAHLSAAATPGMSQQVWENYDFVPGNKVIFYTDFSEDRVGNFARGLKYRTGPVEVVELGGVKMLRSTGQSEFLIPVGKKLPDRFTLEIDVIAPRGSCSCYDVIAFEGGAELDRGDTSAEINWQPGGTTIISSAFNNRNMDVEIPGDVQEALKGSLVHVRVLMDGPYFKMYVNERRMYNIPELSFKRDSVIRVVVHGSDEPEVAVFVTSIRVAESETDVLYDALMAKGRWATQGILFATGKADLQPESRPVLKEIAATMKQHGDLRILIEGHTDNVGSAASNLALSDARAAAVKAALVSEYGVDGGRITTQGLGDTKPSVPNTTAAGRAQNRRVEIVKQ